jgi:hypothetical protein
MFIHSDMDIIRVVTNRAVARRIERVDDSWRGVPSGLGCSCSQRSGLAVSALRGSDTARQQLQLQKGELRFEFKLLKKTRCILLQCSEN